MVGDLIESRIDGQFDGWYGETVFPLQNRQYWQQAIYAYRYHYAYSPAVRIVCDSSECQMHVDGIDEAVVVKQADVVVDSQIVSQFDGWDGDTIFELLNGQVWQQSGPGIAVSVAVQPRALIFSVGGFFKLQVARVSSNVQVERIR